MEHLENEIADFIMVNRVEPKVIIMHPNTWINLFNYVMVNDGIEIEKYNPTLNYRGIKVIRSLDLLEGELQL